MKEITDEEWEYFQTLRKMFTSSFPESFPGQVFICGDCAETDEEGFPHYLLVCRAYGSDVQRFYDLTPRKKP